MTLADRDENVASQNSGASPFKAGGNFANDFAVLGFEAAGGFRFTG